MAEKRESTRKDSGDQKEAHRTEAYRSEETSSEHRKPTPAVEDGSGDGKNAKAEVDDKPLSKERLSSDRASDRASDEEREQGTSVAVEPQKTAKTDKRDRLLGLDGTEKSVDPERLAALSVGQKQSTAPRSGEPSSSGVPAKEAEPDTLGTEAAALEAATGSKVSEHERGASTRRGTDFGTVGKGVSASDLGPRETPRRSSNGEERKGTVPESESGSEKESRKTAIRTTVINRGRSGSQSDEGGGQKSALQDSAGRSEARFVGENSEPGRTEATGLETGRPSVSPATSTGSSSSLEGGRDLAPRHLQQQLKDFATGDVVRHARFVLKENAGGEIRLLLKPEQLGTVRVRLEVQDNRIAGRIIVENTTVRDAFEQTLSELQRAFREAGLETGSLEVTVGEDGQASGQRPATQGRRARAIEELAESVPRIIGELEEPRMINVYA